MRFLALVLLSTLSFSQDAATPAAEPAVEPAPELFQRIVCVGASASGGYGLRDELNARVKIGSLLDPMIVGTHEPILDLGSAYLFQAPTKFATEQIDKAVEHEPSLVVGVDFLFWFTYTPRYTRERVRDPRLDRLEQALAMLDRLECPLLIGDIPDMRSAKDGQGPFGGPLLHESMIPTAEELQQINARIEAWARERGDTTIVPMAEFMRRAAAGEALSLRGNEWEAGDHSNLFQRDKLHPTVEGTYGLLLVALDRLEASRKDVGSSDILWDLEQARKGLMKATEEERQKTLERQRRHEARKKSREDKKRDGQGSLSAA